RERKKDIEFRSVDRPVGEEVEERVKESKNRDQQRYPLQVPSDFYLLVQLSALRNVLSYQHNNPSLYVNNYSHNIYYTFLRLFYGDRMFDLKGKVAIVTGSGRGIGAAIAKTLAEAGAKVVVTSRHENECVMVVGEIKKAGGEAWCTSCDVSKESEVKALIEDVVKKYGSLDILVNNAGVFEQKPVLEMDTAMWKRIQSIDLDGVFFGTKYAALQMKKKGWGRIINISSIAGLSGFASSAAYCAAKFGVRGFTKAAAADLGAYGITVNAICPGLIETKMTEGFTSDKKMLEQFMRPLLIKRAGQPKDIASAALYLASEESSYMTGSEMVVD